ncbi:MAG: phosphate regulon transcriptional regulatory protein PhoB [Hyphomonadaceae bacterium]|nr:phosphate regulon transcriptional regulatory protein PhoB [Hyphomonadaceae bacterium]OUX95604.1 MAG: phosphate regulon transcriptional regulatory protein PhoB [Hyphomonas sp. TMED17]CAI8319547.1 MAG: Phosphate regulon transcriptional regulatory protein PhoB [Hyphomonas sp. TMED17]
MRPFIVIAEDETSVAELLRYNLEALDYKTASATDGEEALLLIEERVPDLVILDWMLPKVSGIEICRRLRSRPQTANIPIMMLTAKTEEADRIRGLETGADDYITKPFSIHELMARVKAVLRRIRPALVEKLITVGDISINRGTYQVTRNGEPIELGPTEFRLLDYFAQHPGRVFSREQLLDGVWGSDVFVEARTVDVHIGRLRKALMSKGGDNPIRTVRSAGYSLKSG